MPTHRGRRALAAALALSLAAATSACGGGGGSSDAVSSSVTIHANVAGSAPQAGQASAIPAAVERAATYIQSVQDTIDPAHTAMLGYLHRNWNVAQFAAMDERAAAAGRQIIAAGDAYPDPDLLNVARLPLPEQQDPLAVPDELVSPVARTVSVGLYCDRQAVDDDALEQMDGFIEEGGYGATHVLFALLLGRDLGCDAPGLIRREPTAIQRVADDLAARVASVDDPRSVVDDLSIEQSAFLVQAGWAELVPAGWLDAVLAAQQPDGGWATEAGRTESGWHATMLALWLLKASQGPGSGAPIVRG